eukprot:scaffold4505_cov103-Isochrysis_galbana.AAC.2
MSIVLAPKAARTQVARDARRTTTLRKAYRRCSTIGYRTPSTEGPLSADFTSLGNTQHRRRRLHLLEHDALPQPAGPPAQLGVGVAGADGEHCPIQHRLPARPARQVQVGGRRVR